MLNVLCVNPYLESLDACAFEAALTSLVKVHLRQRHATLLFYVLCQTHNQNLFIWFYTFKSSDSISACSVTQS